MEARQVITTLPKFMDCVHLRNVYKNTTAYTPNSCSFLPCLHCVFSIASYVWVLTGVAAYRIADGLELAIVRSHGEKTSFFVQLCSELCAHAVKRKGGWPAAKRPASKHPISLSFLLYGPIWVAEAGRKHCKGGWQSDGLVCCFARFR